MRTRCGVLAMACVCLAGLCAALCQAQIAVQPPPVKIEVIKLQYADCEEIAALFGGGSTRGYGMERYLGQGWGSGFGMMGMPSAGPWGSMGPGRAPIAQPLQPVQQPPGWQAQPSAPAGAPMPQPAPAGGGPLSGIFPGLRMVAYPPLNALVVWGPSDQINAFANP